MFRNLRFTVILSGNAYKTFTHSSSPATFQQLLVWTKKIQSDSERNWYVEKYLLFSWWTWKIIRQLDTAKYYTCFNYGGYVYFAIFGIKGSSGWAAIDAHEKVLFEVYNTNFGEASPDYIIEDKIRIVDKNNLIGFANCKGTLVIKPQFEIATSFHKGKAIIGQTCKKVPWDAHAKETDCHHYSIECERHGYINYKGVVMKISNYSFEQIMKEINWKMPDE